MACRSDRQGLAWAGHAPAVVTEVRLGRVGLRTATLTLETTTMINDKIALRELLEKGSDTHCCAR